MALRSLDTWLTVLDAAGLWHERLGSLHLAYHEDEARVLHEFAAAASSRGFFICEVLEPREVLGRCPYVKPDGLRGGLWSPTETCVDPREVIAGLPGYLGTLGVECQLGCAVKGYDRPQVFAGGRKWHADRLWVCTGDDLQTLYPEVYQGSGLVRCKLQMMRSAPLERWRMGPMLAAGLTLRHYPSFADCPSLPAAQERIAREMPAYDRYGIHVMAAQNGNGEVIIGDSHEYEKAIEPFDSRQIEELILSYVNTFLEYARSANRRALAWHLREAPGRAVLRGPPLGWRYGRHRPRRRRHDFVVRLGGAGSEGIAWRIVRWSCS